MPSRTGAAHVVATTRTDKGKVCRTYLLRRSYREDGAVKNETLGNLSHLGEPLIEMIRRSLQGETFVALGEAFEVTGSRAHGHVQAVAAAMQRLDFAWLLGSKSSRERQLVLAMVAARIAAPHTKLATTRWWHTTTLASDWSTSCSTVCPPNELAAGTLVWRPLANPVINKIEVGILVPSHRALSHVTLQFVDRITRRFKQLKLAAMLV